MAPSYKEVSTDLVKLKGPGPFWSVNCFGVTVIGGQNDRPITYRNGKCQFASILPPIYGTDMGFALENNSSLTLTAVPDGGDGDSLMTGLVRVREVYFRETTGERSWAGKEVEIDLGETPCQLKIESNSWALYDRGITHRVFYVNYVDLIGVYYEAAMIPYTSELANNTDEVTINVSPEFLIFNRPLEFKQETLAFPAVSTATYWKGRIWGGGLAPRSFAEGTKLKFTKDSPYVDILPATEGQEDFPDEFVQADMYRGIVDVNTGQIVAFIDRLVHNVRAKIRLPRNIDDNPVWENETVTLDNVTLSGNLANIYSTPIYAGGAGGAIEYGIMTWCPLDTIQDDGFYASGAELVKLTTVGDDLCVVYDRGVGFYSGDVQAGSPPTLRHYIAAKGIGSFNPDNIWRNKDGTVWFEGGGRFYVIKNGQIQEVTQSLGITSFWEKNIQPYGKGLREYQVAYNPQRNLSLMVNLPKLNDYADEFGEYAVAISHDTQTLHPMRFHDWTRFKSLHCILHDNGDWQFYAGTKRGEIYKMLVKGQKFDRRIFGDVTDQEPVDWFYTTGVFWANGTAYTVAVRFLIDTEEEDGINIQIGVDAKHGNLVSERFVADIKRGVSHDELNRLEWIPLHRVGGYALQYQVSGSTDRDFSMVLMNLLEDVQAPRGYTSE